MTEEKRVVSVRRLGADPRKLLDKPRYVEPPSGSAIMAESLGPQIGSDKQTLTEEKVDMRRFGRHNKRTLPALMYFAWRANRSEAFCHIYEMCLNLPVGVDGAGRKELLKGIEVAQPPVVEGEQRKAGLFRRLGRVLVGKGQS